MPPAACPAVPSANTAAVREVTADQLQKLLRRNGTSTHPLLINFWATWCVPCREEFPDLVKIDGEFRQRGLEFFLISLDDVSEIKTTVPSFLGEMKATTIPAFLLNTPEPEAAINAVDPQWSGSLPATFLFDANGKLIYKHTGRIKPDELRTALKQVVSERNHQAEN
ncbi:MAG: TlpA disulfide reductase family protein [Pyrinomonadaceae bacterium]